MPDEGGTVKGGATIMEDSGIYLIDQPAEP